MVEKGVKSEEVSWMIKTMVRYHKNVPSANYVSDLADVKMQV